MLNLLYATLSGIDQTVFTSDCLFIYKGCFGHWELGIGNLLFGAATHVTHCIVPCARMTNYQSNHFLI